MAENVSINVHIRRNADGATRIYPFPEHGWDTDGSNFIWSEGNYACDCNRASFFARSIGEEDPDRSCGDKAFSIAIFDMGGKMLYEDDDWKL